MTHIHLLRPQVRCGAPKKGPEGKKSYVHLLNRHVVPRLRRVGSASSVDRAHHSLFALALLPSTLTATERTLCCVLETHQTADGFRVPDVLVPYMHGVTFVPFVRKLVKGKLVDVSPPPAGLASLVN